MKIVPFIKENKWLLLILTLATFLRFYKLDFQSVWLDEIHTINESNPSNSFSDIYKILLIAEPHPPLYFYIIYILFNIFGYSVIVLKSFSAIIGIAGVLSIYFLGKEIGNKSIGLIASLFTAINQFHIYYSQEGRMYSLLFFTTTVSFYFLLKFIKRPTYKHAIAHGFFAALMIYSHFFALFALFAQYIVFLCILFKKNKNLKKRFFKLCFISGLTTLIFYIPSLNLFIESTKRTSIWIQMPENDIYIQIFKEFFGNYQVNYITFGLIIIVYLITFFLYRKNFFQEENYTLKLLILLSWIIIVLIVPFVLSYINLPMIVSRYYINILPAIIILIAFGVDLIKNYKIKIGLIVLITFFSLNSVFKINKYYSRISKTQFREVTQFIKNNNLNNDPIVTSLGWYLPYFFDSQGQKIIEKNLDDYIFEISKDSSNIQSFWYFDAHLRPFNPSKMTKVFLEKNYVIEDATTLYDAWAKHFVIKKNIKTYVDISEYLPLETFKSSPFNFFIETFSEDSENVSFGGWAYFENESTENLTIQILAIKENKAQKLAFENVLREDVTSYFKSSYDLSKSGFNVIISKKEMPSGVYKIVLLLSNEISGKKGIILTDKTFQNN